MSTRKVTPVAAMYKTAAKPQNRPYTPTKSCSPVWLGLICWVLLLLVTGFRIGPF
jgi:hypothetical protein